MSYPRRRPSLLALIAVTPTILGSPAAIAAAPVQIHGSGADHRVIGAANRIRRFVDDVARVEGSFPAAAVVVVTATGTPLIHVTGRKKAGEPGQVTRASEFYIASQTKTFVGLLGSRLDEQRVLPLDTTLRQVWPELRLPAPADPARITMRDLLSHQAPLTTDTLNHVTAYVRAVPPAEFARFLESETQSRKPGFSYANLGYLIYAAALEARTGRPWQWWLRRSVLGPLALDRSVTFATTSRSRQVWHHRWTDQGWVANPPKPTPLMHSAGGMAATADGLARWMQANLVARDPSAKLSRAIATAQRQVVAARLNDGDLRCGGHSLGWYVCDYKRQRLLLSTGDYVGTQSFTAVLPDAGAGLSFVATSDSAIQRLSLEMIKAFAGMVAGDPAADEMLVKAKDGYAKSIAALATRRLDERTAALSDPEWGRWDWVPDKTETDRLIGHYEDPLFGRLTLERSSGTIAANVGVIRLRLQPAARFRFAAWSATSLVPEPLDFDPASDTVRFRKRAFVRVRGRE